MISTMFRAPVVPSGKILAALAIMALALLCGELLKPGKYWSDKIGSPRYAQILPRTFGDWVEVPGAAAAVVNPVQAEMLDKIYSETVSRTYLNRRTGRAMMLSIAYGRDQSSDTQLHTPEMCYPSQGFRVDGSAMSWLQLPGGKMPVITLDATMGQRHEPLTYFVRNGDQITTKGSLDRNMARLGAAVRGYKVDGLLVRVSEVTRQADAFDLQKQFLLELFEAMQPQDRQKLIGQIANQRS